MAPSPWERRLELEFKTGHEGRAGHIVEFVIAALLFHGVAVLAVKEVVHAYENAAFFQMQLVIAEEVIQTQVDNVNIVQPVIIRKPAERAGGLAVRIDVPEYTPSRCW